MLTAKATWNNGVSKEETFNLESERIVWIVELNEWCKKNGYKLPTITKGETADRCKHGIKLLCPECSELR